MASSEQKWRISILSAVLFLAVVNPLTYQLTDSLLGSLLGSLAENGCPTTLGLAVHTIVFTLLVRYSMDVDIV